jgi:hypothetical protein
MSFCLVIIVPAGLGLDLAGLAKDEVQEKDDFV